MSAQLSPSITNPVALPQSQSDMVLTPSLPEPSNVLLLSIQKQTRFSWHETLLGTISVVSWVVLLDFGYLVNSNAYRQHIAQMQEHGFLYGAENLLMLLLSYTVSNVAFLCCLCGFLGAMADRSDIDGDAHEIGVWSNITQKYVSAVLRGFFVFLILMSGLILLGGTDLSVTTPQTYGHLAGTASLFSFLIGWDAHLFAKFVQKVYNKGLGETPQMDATALKQVDKHTVETAPDGSKREEETHALTAGSLSNSCHS